MTLDLRVKYIFLLIISLLPHICPPSDEPICVKTTSLPRDISVLDSVSSFQRSLKMNFLFSRAFSLLAH